MSKCKALAEMISAPPVGCHVYLSLPKLLFVFVSGDKQRKGQTSHGKISILR